MAKLSAKNQIHYNNALPKLQSADWAEVQAGIEQLAALNIPILLRHLASGISQRRGSLKVKAGCWVEVTVDAAHRKDAALWIAVASGKLDAVDALDLRGYARVPSLQRLAALRQLWLDPAVGDLNPLVGLPNLTNLDLQHTKATRLTASAPLPSVQKLILTSAAQLTDLSILAQLPNLTWLDANSAAITTLDAVVAIPGLQHLSLRGCKGITDFTPLARLTGLTYLRLWETGIEDLAPLSGLVELTYLDLDGTQIRDIAPLHRLSKLATLDIRRCPNLPDQAMSRPWGGAEIATLLATLAPAA